MTVEEFGRLCKALKVAYPDPKFLPDKDSKTLWYEMLKDLPYMALNDALKEHIQTSPYVPTIADLRKRATADRAEISPLEAWALVYKAICNSNYESEAEFAKLPPLCQQAVGRHENLKEWAAMDIGTVESVEQSHFLRAYKAAVEQDKDRRSTSIPVRERLESTDALRLGGA